MSRLVAYDSSGNVIATLDTLVRRDENGMLAVIDFDAHEQSGRRLREIWDVAGAVGSGTWDSGEDSLHDYRVELQGSRIAGLIHKQSGKRRQRSGQHG